MSTWKEKGPAAQYLAERRDAAPLLVRCTHCGWKFRGPAGAAFKEALQHRQAKHPELVKAKRRSSKREWRKEAA